MGAICHAPVMLTTYALTDCFRTLRSDPNLAFVESPALKPPEVVIDQSTVNQYEQELANASQVPLPDEDEDL